MSERRGAIDRHLLLPTRSIRDKHANHTRAHTHAQRQHETIIESVRGRRPVSGAPSKAEDEDGDGDVDVEMKVKVKVEVVHATRDTQTNCMQTSDVQVGVDRIGSDRIELWMR